MGMTKERKSYPSDVSDEEWALCAPYLTLMKEDAPQRTHALRALFNGLRWFVRAGCPWRMMPNDLPPWTAVQQQTRRWVVERSFAWAARFRRLARDYERLASTLAGYHWLAFALLMLQAVIAKSP